MTRTFLVVLAVSWWGCTGEVSAVDAGQDKPDAGQTGADAGAPGDAGVERDAGTDDAGTDAGVDAGEPDAGPWAYDSRPANPTCVAPPPPPSTATVATQRAWPNLTFAAPLELLQAPGQPNHVYVLERGGVIKRIPRQMTAMPTDVTVVLDLSTEVDTSGEGGLLAMAFHPNWPATQELYVSYTASGSGGAALRSTISRFKSTDQGQRFDPASEEKLLELNQPYSNHNGGDIGFGPDGFLYIGFGDGGSGGDPGNRAQSLNTNHGKFLRIDVNVPFAQRYGIPTDNPFASTGTACNRNNPQDRAAAGTRCAEIYAVGVRNPWRWSFDPVGGDLWAGDVGQDAREEVDVIVRGANYGWKVREGLACYGAATCATAGFTDPVADYTRGDGNSITGGYVYRGSSIPSLVGRFIYGDFGSGRVFALTPTANGGWQHTRLLSTGLGIAAFGQTSDGEVYVLDIYSGEVHQLVPMGTPPADTFPKTLSATGCFDAQDPTKPVTAMIPYELNAPFWSDGAVKQRHFAIPDGTTITVKPDGDFDFPNGTVISKTFFLAGKRIETRLLMRHGDGTWAGYSYEWNDAETDATLLPAGKLKTFGAQTWVYPSRTQCMQCHTAAAGRSLGPEVAQLNRTLRYPQGVERHQLSVLEGLGYLSAPLGMPVAQLPKLEDPHGTGPLEARARAWLHSNCSQCHRDGMGRGPADYRYSLSFKATNTCDVDPVTGDLGISGAKLIKPGAPLESIVSRRIHALDAARMPLIGSLVVDQQGAALIDQWISSLTSCPP